MSAVADIKDIGERASEQSIDLVRLKWFDPNDADRFERKEPIAPDNAGNEDIFRIS